MDQYLDVAIIGGTVIDGTAAGPFKADVGVKHGAIAVIGDLSDTRAKETLQADELVVAPGFIDAHGHSDYTLLVDGRAVSQVSQGVTTEVIGNCGHGCEPLTDDLDRFKGNIYGFDGSVELTWRTTAEYLERLAGARPAINIVPLTPAGNLRRAAVADPDDLNRPTGLTEQARILHLIAEAMDAGSNGISFGLEYRQEASAKFDELVEQSDLAGKLGGAVAIHTRDKDQRALEGVEEAVSIARESGAPVQVSHILPRRTAPVDSLEQIVESLSAARDEGLDIAFDVHTRTHGITNLSDCISPGVLKRGPEGIQTALADSHWAEDMQHGDSIIHRFASSGWESIQVFSTTYTPEFVGLSIAEIARSENREPWDGVRLLLAATNGDVHDVMVVCDSYAEEDILTVASLPGCLVGSDATTLCPDGPLAKDKFLGAYTWAAWLYSKLARDSGRLSPAETVRKLAAEPAERFKLADRGTIAVGKQADLVVFDPATFGTAGSIADPNLLAAGVKHVIVNGAVALRDGVTTGQRAGRILLR